MQLRELGIAVVANMTKATGNDPSNALKKNMNGALLGRCTKGCKVALAATETEDNPLEVFGAAERAGPAVRMIP